MSVHVARSKPRTQRRQAKSGVRKASIQAEWRSGCSLRRSDGSSEEITQAEQVKDGDHATCRLGERGTPVCEREEEEEREG